MILIISTIERYEIKIGLIRFNNSVIPDRSSTPRLRLEELAAGSGIQIIETQNQSTDLLPLIDKFLKNNQIKLNDLTGILVNLGPGSFTGVRIGVTTANALAWSLNIPVFGFREGDLEKTIEKLKNSKEKEFSKSVLPLYEK
jgi:tRNA threonylcarbamoyl adenosine modification protein YeaZ